MLDFLQKKGIIEVRREENNMNIAATIIEIRKQRKMTQEDFAKLFHVTRQTVSNWENEKSYPDIKTLVEISDEFDISLDNPADH